MVNIHLNPNFGWREMISILKILSGATGMLIFFFLKFIARSQDQDKGAVMLTNSNWPSYHHLHALTARKCTQCTVLLYFVQCTLFTNALLGWNIHYITNITCYWRVQIDLVSNVITAPEKSRPWLLNSFSQRSGWSDGHPPNGWSTRWGRGRWRARGGDINVEMLIGVFVPYEIFVKSTILLCGVDEPYIW